MGIFSRLFHKPEEKQPVAYAVVLAAGASTRMEGVDKIFAPILGIPALARTLAAFQSSAVIDEILVVTRSDQIAQVGELCKTYALDKVRLVVRGGDSRLASALIGVGEVRRDAELIAIHDGARPLVSLKVIEDAVMRAAECGAAVPAVPVSDTVKIGVDGYIWETPRRDTLFSAQTPQVFQAELIKAALTRCRESGVEVTDDASAVEQLGMRVALTAGDRQNIKLTTQEDLLLAEAILARETVY